VVIKDKYFHWFGNLRDIGINKTSTGIGKKIDSIKLIKDNRVLDWNFIMLFISSLNIIE